MLDADRFFKHLETAAAGRARVPIDSAWVVYQKLYPKLSISTDARTRLLEILRANEERGLLRFPKGKAGWDFSARPPLPQWVEMIRRQAPEAVPLRMDQIPWPPELAFAANLKSRSHLDVLLRIRDWLAAGGRRAVSVPLKERSAEVFADEKRLDRLLKTDLFAPGALDLRALRCYPVFPDLVWERGRTDADAILVVENSNTYHSFCHWNTRSGAYAACVYGAGFTIRHTYQHIERVLQETNPRAQVRYFGDLDVAGIRIPIELSGLLRASGLPEALPAETWYAALIDQLPKHIERLRRTQTPVREPRPGDKLHPGAWTAQDLQWFSPGLRDRVEHVFKQGYRLPQEYIGTEFLSNVAGE